MILERSSLFVPATERRRVEKAAGLAADSVCLDLEDAIAPREKVAARTAAAAALREVDFGPRRRILRINAVETPLGYRDIIEVVEAAGDRIDALMVPKTSSAGEVNFVARLLDQIEASRGFSHRIGIQAQIETAAGFVNLNAIAAASPRLECLILGAGDYSASMQMPAAHIGEPDEHDRIYPGHRWHAVMHGIVAAARANGLRCLDGPFAAFRNAPGLATSAALARAMGFDGKQCIHPAQIDPINSVFSPTVEEARHAGHVLAAYEAAAAEGRGAFELDGHMIDAASIRMAGVVAERGRLIRAREGELNMPVFEDFQVGQVIRHPVGRTVTTTDNIWFTLLTNNPNPIHFDAHYAAQTEFGKPLMNSTFTLALVVGLSVNDISRNAVNLGWDEVRLPAPVFEGDTIYAQTEVLALRESKSRPHMGILQVKTTGYKQDGTVVLEYRRSVMVYRRGFAPETPTPTPTPTVKPA